MSAVETQPIRIGVIDDHPIVRVGVTLMIESQENLLCIGEAGSVAEAIQLVETESPDLIILDLWLGGNDGLELVFNLRAIAPEMRILVYSMNDELIYGPRVLRAGASGYVMKDSGLAELSKAIDAVCRSERYMSERLKRSLAEESLGTPSAAGAQVANLTDRELQILRLIGIGKSTGEIADSLHISPKTVGAHRDNLKAKLGVDSAAQLVRKAAVLVETHIL